jgi:hypothetical protein
MGPVFRRLTARELTKLKAVSELDMYIREAIKSKEIDPKDARQLYLELEKEMDDKLNQKNHYI